ncbi:MAG: glycerate-2-kinase family protein, partial [Edaphobacter sp.]
MLREMAGEIFRQALADCSIEQAMTRKVRVMAGVDGQQLLVDGVEAIDLERVKYLRIVAVGKASADMLRSLLECLPEEPRYDLAGVLIARELPPGLPLGFQFFAGGHPLPNEASCAGARAALEMLHDLQEDKARAAETLCLFLISGGASAMMELPLDPAIPLADMVSFYRELVHCGASIAEINCVRKHFSAIKGGRLGRAAGGIETLSLLVSDVPPGHLDALASGPTLPDRSTIEQCREILARYRLLERFPASVREFFERSDLPETPKPGSFAARTATLLTSDDLADRARIRAEELGFYAVVDNACDDWNYRAAAEYLLNRLRGLRSEHPKVCLISAGEVTVEL